VNNQELLIDHLDRSLQGQSLPGAVALLESDANAREEWQYLQTAVEAAQHAALYQKVGAIRAEMQAAPVIPLKQAPIRNMASRIIRIAAIVVVLLSAVAIYKYATVSHTDFFEQHYTAYELNTTRSGVAPTPVEAAYRNSNWNEVVALYNSSTVKTNKDHFLAGMALVELKQYTLAIARFNDVLSTNARDNDSYFQDEAEYYLALAYLANDQANNASRLLKQISAENGHLYQQKAADMLGLDLKILEIK
jgi:hypothetical protein